MRQTARSVAFYKEYVVFCPVFIYMTGRIMDQTYLEQIYNVYQNAHDMLHDRHYEEIVSGKHCKTLEEFEQTYVQYGTLDKEAMCFVRMKSVDESHKRTKDPSFISVYFTHEESIGIKHIVTISEKMVASKISHCILIYPKNITSSAKKYMEKTAKLKIEAFSEDDLIINITKHVLMPKHQVLTSAEKKLFLTNSRLTESQLPKILVTDPISKYYGMRRGDVVRIIRNSDTSAKSVTFRLCN